jgi:hypothetical protein
MVRFSSLSACTSQWLIKGVAGESSSLQLPTE